MKVTVVGTGYVGLVTGTCFADVGNGVTCVDIDKNKIAQMQNGQVPIYEPELESVFERNVREKRMSFTTSLEDGVRDASVIFLALPTPPADDGSADLSYVLGVAEQLGRILKDYVVIVDKSTVPVGTAEQVRAKIAEHATVEFDVVSNPEFLREGRAVADFMRPDRIVIGSSSSRAQKVMKKLYQPFIGERSTLYFMDERSAEMTKYAANSFLAAKISFMNEIANLCDAVGANVDSVRIGIGSDTRIGNQFLYPGIGYGGSCFPKDVAALARTAKDYGQELKIIDAVEAVNARQKKLLTDKVSAYYKGDLQGKIFALWGLAFKPDTDDIREAPALEIIKILTDSGADVVAFDPEAIANVKKRFEGNSHLRFVEGRYDALEGADALLIATEWNEFQVPNFDKLRDQLKEPVIFDGRNLFQPDTMAELGFHYESIGRPLKVAMDVVA